MIKPFTSKFLSPTKKFRRLSVLVSVHDDPNASQQKIAQTTHLSSSMVNNYIKELKQKGFIHIAGKTNRTQSYHLTPSGEKKLSSLLLTYSAEIIQLYGAAKREVIERIHNLHLGGIRRVALFGAAETAEVVYTALKELPLRIDAIVDSDPRKQGKPFNGLIIQHPKRLKEIKPDVVVVTSFGRQEEIHREIIQILGKETRIVKLSDL